MGLCDSNNERGSGAGITWTNAHDGNDLVMQVPQLAASSMYHEMGRKMNGYGTHAHHMPSWLTTFLSFRYVGVYTTVLVASVARRTVEFVHGMATGTKAVV